MPAQYEHIRDSEFARLRKQGYSTAEAMKKAKSIAAATWNARHPDNPLTPHREPREDGKTRPGVRKGFKPPVKLPR